MYKVGDKVRADILGEKVEQKIDAIDEKHGETIYILKDRWVYEDQIECKL